MDYLPTLLDNCDIPALTAFLLGLLTALSPCPLAANIIAVGFISKDIENKKRIFLRGVLYTTGRILSYSALGAVLITAIRSGTDMFGIQDEINMWGEWLLAPVLIVMGVMMLFGDQLPLPQFRMSASGTLGYRKGSWGSMLLGVLFALAFCPSSGLFYFGMLIPMSAATSGGYLLPVVFATATGLPVVAAAWILAYSVASIGNFYKRVALFQRWFNRVVAALFILAGIYYGYMNYL